MHFFPFPYQSSFRSRVRRGNFLLSGRGLGFIVCSVTSKHYDNAREISMEITCDKAISCHVLDGYTSVMAIRNFENFIDDFQVHERMYLN